MWSLFHAVTAFVAVLAGKVHGVSVIVVLGLAALAYFGIQKFWPPLYASQGTTATTVEKRRRVRLFAFIGGGLLIALLLASALGFCGDGTPLGRNPLQGT